MNISGPAAVAKPEMLFYAPGDLTVTYNILQCVYCEDNIVPTEDELLKLEDAHYRKIDLSDGIYVVNMDGYIGTSVKKEIEYAERHEKEVLYHYNQ